MLPQRGRRRNTAKASLQAERAEQREAAHPHALNSKLGRTHRDNASGPEAPKLPRAQTNQHA
eukprot:7246662-Alexandrium_andersonii.AAC.1